MAEQKRPDRCPGVQRPWIAEDGALLRLRLVGGRMDLTQLRSLLRLAEEHGDGDIHLTSRANLQLRGVGHVDGRVHDDLVGGLYAANLLPSLSHELVRNIMLSPLTGRLGGRADLWPLAQHLDVLLMASPRLADLSGRFLFVLDDGRGDVAGRSMDMGAVAVDPDHVQLRVGEHWGDVLRLEDAPGELVALAERFLAHRDAAGTGVWHVDELPEKGASVLPVHHSRDLRTQVTTLPLPHGELVQDDGRTTLHLDVPDGVLDVELATRVLELAGPEIVVTPWRSLLLPDLEDLPR